LHYTEICCKTLQGKHLWQSEVSRFRCQQPVLRTGCAAFCATSSCRRDT
jgi:hypothetical protein